MRLLISAYACEPGKGSEPGVGWHWSLAAAQVATHVTVITRANNRTAIEAHAEELPPNMTFVYVDLPRPLLRFKRGARGARLYYGLWQRKIRGIAARLHEEAPFDVAHHLTWASMALPIGLSRGLQAPLVIGPVGGAVPASWAQWRDFGVHGLAHETLRYVGRGLRRLNPRAAQQWRHAAAVIAQNPESAAEVDWYRSGATQVYVNAGIASQELTVSRRRRPYLGCQVRAVFAGRLVAYKGLRSAIRALATEAGARVDLVVLGDGPERRPCERLARRLGVSDRVHFKGEVARGEVLTTLDEADVLLLPTQHDEGAPLIVVEAMARGVRPVALSRGGPASSVGSGGVLVDVHPLPTLPARLADAVHQAASIEPAVAVARAGEFDWDRLPRFLADLYARVVTT